MIDGKRVIAIVPARGGSKGIKNKNIVDIAGKPLIAYSLNAAQESKYIDAIVVSTDSAQIADVAEKYGASVPYLRPDKLATDTAKTIDVIVELLNTLSNRGDIYDILVLLQPTSPLRTAEDIDRALEMHIENQGASIVAVSEVADHPVLMRYVDENGKLDKLLNENSTVRRQDMRKVYRVNGAIYINRIEEINAATSFNDNELGYIMSKERSVDIDTPVDLELMKYYLGIHMKKENGC